MDVEAPGDGSRNVETTGGLRGVQGCTINLIGCGASGAYAPGPDEEEEEVTMMPVTSHSSVNQQRGLFTRSLRVN